MLILDEGSASKFCDVVLDPYGLEIAPKTHEYVKVGEDTHVECFAIVENGFEYLSLQVETTEADAGCEDDDSWA